MLDRSTLVFGPVTWAAGDDTPDWLAYYDPLQRWNGAIAAPYFPRTEVERMAAYCAGILDAPGAAGDECDRITWDASRAEYRLTSDAEPDHAVIVPSVTLDDGTPLYAIGARSYTWIESEHDAERRERARRMRSALYNFIAAGWQLVEAWDQSACNVEVYSRIFGSALEDALSAMPMILIGEDDASAAAMVAAFHPLALRETARDMETT